MRLAVLSPALAIIIRDLGHEDVIAGRHAFDLVLDPAVPVAGSGTGEVHYETLLRIEPTHIVRESGAEPPPPKLVELAATRGWKIESFPLLTLADIRSATVRLDQLISSKDDLPGSEDRARSRADQLLAGMDQAWAARDGFAERCGRTLVLAWTDPPGVMGPGSFHHQLIAAMGGHPIPETGSPYLSLTVEDVIRLDPDTIVLVMPGVTARENDAMTKLLGPLARVDLRAVRFHRIALIGDELCHTPSTALIGVADELARIVLAWEPIGDSAESAETGAVR